MAGQYKSQMSYTSDSSSYDLGDHQPSSYDLGGHRTSSPAHLLPDDSQSESSMCNLKSAAGKRYKYLRRLFKYRDMDFEYAFWQMIYLFIAPQKVYRSFHYSKQTKDQYARDDPAFLVLLSLTLVLSSIGFACVLGLSFGDFLEFTLWIVFVDCIGVGLVIATAGWFLSNRYLLPIRGGGGGAQSLCVEWGYSFDVHLNAFFPLLVILHILQLVVIHYVHNSPSLLATCIGNTFWLAALSYYVYITFLGYNALPFLKRTSVLLTPFMLIVILYILSLVFNINFTSKMCNFYLVRVL